MRFLGQGWLLTHLDLRIHNLHWLRILMIELLMLLSYLWMKGFMWALEKRNLLLCTVRSSLAQHICSLVNGHVK